MEPPSSPLQKSPFTVALAFLLMSAAIGAASSLFLNGLELCTRLREEMPALFLLAPVVGALTGYWYTIWAPQVAAGTALVASIHRAGETSSQNREIPRPMDFLIVVSTWLSHLAGLSVGREGTAVQLGAAISSRARLLIPERSAKLESLLLTGGIAAGFGAVFGVPFAGAVFALELKRQPLKNLKFDAGVAITCSMFADLVARWLFAQHAVYPGAPALTSWISISAIGSLVASIALFATLATLFLFVLHHFRIVWARLIPRDTLRPAIGGALYATLFFAPATWHRFAGLGVPEIMSSFEQTKEVYAPFAKLLLTVYSIGVGFRGGEVTPLFFMGATAGSALSSAFAMPPASLAMLGLVSVFAAAANLPFTCAVMAAELFGPAAFLPALVVCYASAKLTRGARLYDM